MIRNMKNDGMSIRSIAKEMGISRNSVRKYLKGEPVIDFPVQFHSGTLPVLAYSS